MLSPRRAMLLFAVVSSLALAAGKEAKPPPKPTLVQMTAEDGKKITGWLWGAGDTALILCHGRARMDGGKSFDRECQYFVTRGVRCLALNHRGYPADAPPDAKGREHDVMGAFGHLATHGAKRIFVLGSSMGGFAAFGALESLRQQPQFAGLIVLSAFDKTALDEAPCAKLIVYAADDARLYKYMQMMVYKAAAPKTVLVFKTGGHGQQLLKTHGQEVVDQVWMFIQANQ